MTLDDAALDLILRSARSQNAWQDKPVSDEQLRALYDILKWGPTTGNSSPARILFLRTQEAKKRLQPALFRPTSTRRSPHRSSPSSVTT